MMSFVVSRILRCKPAVFRLSTLQQHYYTAVQRPEVLGSIGQVFSKQTALSLHGHSCSFSSQIPAIHVAGRYTRWWKAAVTASVVAAALFNGGTAAAACSRYVEIVPYTDRFHLIVRSTEFERRMGDLAFRYVIEMYGASNILDPSPDSVRVYKITCQLVRAIRRGLIVRSLKQGRNPEESRRQTKHLDGLDWDPVIVRDKKFGAVSAPGGKIILLTGCFDHVRTDAEIASIIAHEIGHLIARHGMEQNLYMRKKWIPSRLRQYLRQRLELEADHIGILLVGAAGYDQRVFPKTIEKIVKLAPGKACATHPSAEERLQLLSQENIMEEALELYRDVKVITSFCLMLKCMATSPRLARSPFVQKLLRRRGEEDVCAGTGSRKKETGS